MTRFIQSQPRRHRRTNDPTPFERVVEIPDRSSRGRRFRRLTPASLQLCAFLILGVLGTSRAEGGVEYGPHIAYTKAAGSDNGNYLVGGHIELLPASFLGVRGAVDYRSSERFPVGGVPGGTVRVKSIPVTVSGKLYLPLTSSASPFLMAGAGWYRVVYDYSSAVERVTGLHDQSVSTFGWHLGGGLKLGLSPTVSLTGEAQYVFVDPEKRLDEQVRDQIRNLDYNSVTFGLGLSVAF